MLAKRDRSISLRVVLNGYDKLIVAIAIAGDCVDSAGAFTNCGD